MKVATVAVLPTGECVCTTRVTATSGNIMMYNTEGEQVWTKELPHTATGTRSSRVILSTTPSSLIVMCDQNTQNVTVLDASGQELREFPPGFIQKPTSMCVDSQGDVLIYDDANHTISLFCINGTYVKKILKPDERFEAISVSRDAYLLCKRNHCGLYLYEL